MTPTQTGLPQVKALLALFFISGFSALCYQIVWQRVLFATFGINIESVTIIVSLFMFGLGLGALFGSWLQKYPQRLLSIFVAFELLIGLFGLCSQSLIAWLGGIPGLQSLYAITACVYLIFALPTLLMGATLPVLVGHINRYVGHTGSSVSWLYASNTAGAVAAAILTVTLLFTYLGLHAVILLAATMNFLTAISAWILYRKGNETFVPQTEIRNRLEEKTPLSATTIMFLGLAIGFITLSQELIWFRILGYLSANSPKIFGLMLGAILAGIAMASVQAGEILSSGQRIHHYIASTLTKMAAAWFISFPLIIMIAAYGGGAGKIYALSAGLVMAATVAYMSGGVFPVLCHLLQQKTGQSAGHAVGRLYFINVMGATLGPLLTGFIVFEYVPFQAIVLITGLMVIALVLLLIARSGFMHADKTRAITAAAMVTLLGFGLHGFAYDRFLEKLQFVQPAPAPFEALNYNRSGFISIANGRIFGNGAYDGTMNIDPTQTNNGIVRFYAIGAFHPHPKRILEIGLSGGSSAKILSMYQPLEELVSVEINKGYTDILRNYPDHADLMTNPKVSLVVDDGRRWLRHHPEEKFDVITTNTIHHWRSNATNMLSREFMEMCKEHLNPGGYIFINGTGSEDVAYTAAHVFKYVSVPFGMTNMVLAGDTPSPTTREMRLESLKKFVYPDGRQAFQDKDLLNKLADLNYPNQRDEILARKDLMLITDDNMATEFKRPRRAE